MEGGSFIMVTFPDLSNLSSDSTIGNFLSLPNATYPYFWAWILGAIWFIISSTLYFTEKEKRTKANLLSSMAVSCFAILILSLTGTILGIVSLEIMIYILVISALIIGIWIFSNK